MTRAGGPGQLGVPAGGGRAGAGGGGGTAQQPGEGPRPGRSGPVVSAADDHPGRTCRFVDPLGNPASLAGRGLQGIACGGNMAALGVVKKSRSSVGRAVRCFSRLGAGATAGGLRSDLHIVQVEC
jgi:hypothetical protein